MFPNRRFSSPNRAARTHIAFKMAAIRSVFPSSHGLNRSEKLVLDTQGNLHAWGDDAPLCSNPRKCFSETTLRSSAHIGVHSHHSPMEELAEETAPRGPQ